MKNYITIKICFMIIVLSFSNLYSQTYTSATSGSWTTGSTWVGGTDPNLTGGAGNLSDDVVIDVGHTVTLSGDLTVKSGASLTIKGTLIITSGGNVDFENGSTILVESTGTLEMNGLTNSNNSTNVTINGNLIINGNYTAGTGASVSGTGDMEVSGTSSGSGTTFGTTLSCSDCAIDGTTGEIENAIINGSQTAQHAPIEPYWSWTYSQQIYYQSEIDQAGDITELSFEYNGNSSYTDQVEIYLGHTTKSSFSNSSDWVDYSDLTLVYDGSYSVSNTAGWYTINFDTDFTYNNSNNLVIAVYEKTSGYHSASDEFYTADGGAYRVLTYYDDWTNPDPASPPSADSRQVWTPSLKLGISSGGGPLPISLVSFEGIENDEHDIELSWVVASQMNNDYFTIDHSTDGYKWETLSIIDGAGNSTQILTYAYMHTQPILGVNYYRLTQTDFDGESETFGPIAVYSKRKREYIVGMYNYLGQKVNQDYKGLIIIMWDNGEIQKIYK